MSDTRTILTATKKPEEKHQPLPKLEKKLTEEETLRLIQERGEKKFYNYAAQRARISKKEDLFARTDFGTEEEQSTLIKDADVAAYLESLPDFTPGSVFAVEHSEGIGQVVKGKQTAPNILTLSNVPVKKIDLSEYGLNLDDLLKEFGLTTIKMSVDHVMSGIGVTDDAPVIGYHLTSGGEKEKQETRQKEIKLIQKVMIAVDKKHGHFYSGGDSNDNLIKISLSGKTPEIKDGHMVMNESIREVLDGLNGVTLELLNYSNVKIKERGPRINRQLLGPGSSTNQQDKYKSDAASKFRAEKGTVRREGDKRNSELLAHYPLPREGTEEYLATSDSVSDHRPSLIEDVKKEIAVAFRGGQLQEGPKAFTDPKKLFKYPEAFKKDENGNEIIKEEVIKADVEAIKKFYALLVSNCARTPLENPLEIPKVDPNAIKEPLTALGYLDNFYQSLSKIGIDPFVSDDEMVAQFNFDDVEQVNRLNVSLKKIGMPPIRTAEELKAALIAKEQAGGAPEDKQKDHQRASFVRLALRDAGINPFKSEEKMMSTFRYTDENQLDKLAEAVNKFLRVQAIEPEEKEAAFTTELRKSFKKSMIELFKSDEFEEGYHQWANPEHVKEYGHIRRGSVPNENAALEALADSILEYANAPSDSGSRSPLNRWFQKALRREISGGYVIVAGKMPTVQDMRRELCIENGLYYAIERARRKTFVLKITETSTKGLGINSKEPLVGKLYAETAEDFLWFIKNRQTALLQMTAQAEQNANATLSGKAKASANPYSSFSKTLQQSREQAQAVRERDVATRYQQVRGRMGY